MAKTLSDEVRPERAAEMMEAHPELAIRVERIDARRETAWLALDAAWQNLHEARAAKVRVDAILAEYEEAADRGVFDARPSSLLQPGPNEPPLEGGTDTARLQKARRAAEAAAAKVERAAAAQEAANAIWEDASHLQASCERYLHRVEKYEPASASAEPRRGETALDAVARVRKEIAALAAEAAKVAAAPQPADEVKRRIRRSIAMTAEQSTPIVVGRDGVRWPVSLAGGRPQTDALALLAMMFPEKLAALADAAVPDSAGAMSDRDRDAELARIAAKALDLAREEEGLIASAEEQGFTQITRRGDMDPRAALCVAGPPPRG